MKTIPKLNLPFATGSHKGQPDACLLEFAWAMDRVTATKIGRVCPDNTKTDHPSTVHPIIADIGIRAWDSENDKDKRVGLLRTIACQLDTSDVIQEVTNGLAAFVCKFVADRMPEDTDARVITALRSAEACLLDPTDEKCAEAAEAARAARAAWAAWAAWAARAAFYAELLVAIIAEFDRLTGRIECRKITAADFRAAEKVILG